MGRTCFFVDQQQVGKCTSHINAQAITHGLLQLSDVDSGQQAQSLFAARKVI
jgi:hypothetical protein